MNRFFFQFISLARGAVLLLLFSSCESLAPMAARVVPPERKAYEAKASPSLEVRDSLLELFNDPELSRIVDLTLTNNPDLKRSCARLQEQGFNLEKTRGRLFPTLQGNAIASRSESPGFPPMSFYQLGLDASWEVDVWGKLRSGVTAAEAEAFQAQADYEAVRQSLAAQTIQAWFGLVRATKFLDLDRRRVESFLSTEKSVQRRFDLGQASLAELDLARTDLKNARADVEATLDFRDRAARQLRVLTGEYPNKKLRANKWPTLLRKVPEGLPSDLLCRRPDIVSAFQAILAADARTDIAHKELFPSFNLTASGGRQSNQLSDLFRSGFDYWTLAGNVIAPIFNAGQLKNELFASGKRAEQAFYIYQGIVLNALREVEDALGSEHYLAREERARLDALKSSRLAMERTRRDYEAGLADLLILLEAQRRTFITEQQTIEIRYNRLINRVALALALGRGT